MEIIFIPLWLLGCVLVTMLAESKGQTGIVAFLVSFLLSPVLMLLVVLRRPNFKREEIEAKRHAELLEAAKSGGLK